MFELEKRSLPGVFVIHGRIFKDDRGEFRKSVHKPEFEKLGLKWSFDEQFYTISHKNVVRGMHIQLPPHDHEKLVYCVQGQVLDVLVDLRKDSPQFGQTMSVTLDHESGESLYIPKGVAHGFRSMTDNSIMMYAVTTCHSPAADTGVRWNSIPFDWGIVDPIVSVRDKSLPLLGAFISPFMMDRENGVNLRHR